MTIIEIRPFRNGWQVYEAAGVQPVFLRQEDAISYAEGRAGGEVCDHFHLKQGSIPSKLKQTVKDGMLYQSPVQGGDLIGHVGNSSGSSELHLNIGYVRLDKSGRGNLIPLQDSNVKLLSGHTVVGVPATDQYKTD